MSFKQNQTEDTDQLPALLMLMLRLQFHSGAAGGAVRVTVSIYEPL